MQHQSANRFHYDPEQPEVLRIQTNGLCSKLEEVSRRLTAHTLKFEDLKEDRFYQPEALALAEAMLHHVPDSDPRIMIESRSGNFRTFKSDDITMISVSLAPATAFAQLITIISSLRALTGYLPAPPDIELTLIPAPDEPPLKSPDYQAGLREFKQSLDSQGLEVSHGIELKESWTRAAPSLPIQNQAPSPNVNTTSLSFKTLRISS